MFIDCIILFLFFSFGTVNDNLKMPSYATDNILRVLWIAFIDPDGFETLSGRKAHFRNRMTISTVTFFVEHSRVLRKEKRKKRKGRK